MLRNWSAHSSTPSIPALTRTEPATRLGCYVLAGFPSHSPSSLASNSLLILSPTGSLTALYAKHFLYTTDESWATPGPAFTALDLAFPPSSPSFGGSFRLCPAICMDLNPEKFEAPFEAYELARFAEARGAEVMVCAMAWLDSDPGKEEEEEEGGEEWEKVRGTLGYWAARLEPLLGSGVGFVSCNRVGREGGEKLARFCLCGAGADGLEQRRCLRDRVA